MCLLEYSGTGPSLRLTLRRCERVLAGHDLIPVVLGIMPAEEALGLPAQGGCPAVPVCSGDEVKEDEDEDEDEDDEDEDDEDEGRDLIVLVISDTCSRGRNCDFFHLFVYFFAFAAVVMMLVRY